jgi:hypothetical protein
LHFFSLTTRFATAGTRRKARRDERLDERADHKSGKPRRKSSEVLRVHECSACTKRYGTRAALALHFKLKHELPLRASSGRSSPISAF